MLKNTRPIELDELVDHLASLRDALIDMQYSCTFSTVRIWWLAEQSGQRRPESLQWTVQRNTDRTFKIDQWATELIGEEWVPPPPVRKIDVVKGNIVWRDE